ncbi:MAG: ABC transporter ATP-binding protein [Oscillospiraceae bacterium]
MNAVMTDNLTKYYGKARGIADVSLTVEEGDFFGFIGPNGAGKSTTIRTLLGLIAPTGGSAEIFGKDICKQRTEILADIGYLPSETMFYSGMRVKDVLRLSARLRKTDCSGEAEKLCERLELDTSRKIDELSLGNRKKVGIVCALQHRPKLYILDEPTSGLDPLMQREFYSLLQERNEEGATVFLSSHVLSEVQRYCKHAAVIREGRLLACDSVENLGHTGAKRVTLRGVTAVPELEHIRDVKTSAEGVSFLYGGKADLLLKALSKLPLTDVTIAEPDLEEIFMHYYAKEDGGNDDI